MKRRATRNYLILALLAAAALWAILLLGSHLRAPPRLAGQFDVYWEWGIIPPSGGQKLPREVQIDQSGLFLTVTAKDQIVSRGRLLPIESNDGSVTYRYERDSTRWPLDIREITPSRLTLLLGNRSGIATRDQRAQPLARPAPATYPSTAPTTATISAAQAPMNPGDGASALPALTDLRPETPSDDPEVDAAALDASPVAAPDAKPIVAGDPQP